MSKTIVITGGSRGIGRATAVLCARRGWSVAIQYRGNRQAADETAGLVEQAGGRLLAVQGDVSSEADVMALFEAAQDRFGALHGVVNNAGIVAPAQDVADMSAQRLRAIFEINVLGAFLVAREAARRLS
ncbi:SDR family NAD(P)-dependent oxidoreductase, partial [Ralstonia pseudosolanacearum]